MLAPLLVLLLTATEKPRVAVLEVVASDPSMAKRAAELEELALLQAHYCLVLAVKGDERFQNAFALAL